MEVKLICHIGQLIKESGLRTDFIADKLGVSTKQVQNYCKGTSLIPFNKAYILIKLLRCNIGDLYTADYE